MREILTDLYKRLAGFFQSAAEEKESVKDVATNRLKLVLMQDRTNLTPYLLEKMRGELIDLLSKYVEMDKEALELNFAHEGDSMALMLSIPVVRAKDEEEIQAILEAEEAAKEKEDVKEETEEPEEVEGEVSEEEITEEIGEEICEKVCACGMEEKEEKSDSPDCDGTCDCGCQDGGECSCANEEEKPITTKKSKKRK